MSTKAGKSNSVDVEPLIGKTARTSTFRTASAVKTSRPFVGEPFLILFGSRGITLQYADHLDYVPGHLKELTRATATLANTVQKRSKLDELFAQEEVQDCIVALEFLQGMIAALAMALEDEVDA